MDYELAKKLKEAGFPQTGVSYSTNPVEYKGTFYEAVYMPTLEELIEACVSNNELGGFTMDFTEDDITLERTWDINGHFLGKTPTEAVANLYLALHSK